MFTLIIGRWQWLWIFDDSEVDDINVNDDDIDDDAADDDYGDDDAADDDDDFVRKILMICRRKKKKRGAVDSYECWVVRVMFEDK